MMSKLKVSSVILGEILVGDGRACCLLP